MRTSDALSQFKISLSMTEELLRIERDNYRNPPREHEQKAVQGLRGAVAVLSVAAFEHFLRSAIEEYLSALTTHPPVSMSRLPDRMRICSVFNTLDGAMRGPRFRKPLPKKDRLPGLDAACRKVVSDVINPSAFTSTGGNPGSQTVGLMLKDLDIPDVFAAVRPKFLRKWRKPEAQSFIPDKLDEIVNRRHVVAHTTDALKITRAQLKEGIKFLRVLGEVLDQEVGTKTAGLIRMGRAS